MKRRLILIVIYEICLEFTIALAAFAALEVVTLAEWLSALTILAVKLLAALLAVAIVTILALEVLALSVLALLLLSLTTTLK